jgi:hypothetical protein
MKRHALLTVPLYFFYAAFMASSKEEFLNDQISAFVTHLPTSCQQIVETLGLPLNLVWHHPIMTRACRIRVSSAWVHHFSKEKGASSAWSDPLDGIDRSASL